MDGALVSAIAAAPYVKYIVADAITDVVYPRLLVPVKRIVPHGEICQYEWQSSELGARTNTVTRAYTQCRSAQQGRCGEMTNAPLIWEGSSWETVE